MGSGVEWSGVARRGAEGRRERARSLAVRKYVNGRRAHKERPNHRGSGGINLAYVSFANRNSRFNNILARSAHQRAQAVI
jgi:hypothetical protein